MSAPYVTPLTAAQLSELAPVAQELARVPGGGRGMTAKGEFEVKVTAQASDDKTLGRLLIDKTFQGGLTGQSSGQMLSAGAAVKGPAGYVAIEKVSGTPQDRSGTFVLQHSGILNWGEAQLTVRVVPDSGTNELAGLAGNMAIKITGGKHFYEFDYTLEADRPPTISKESEPAANRFPIATGLVPS